MVSNNNKCVSNNGREIFDNIDKIFVLTTTYMDHSVAGMFIDETPNFIKMRLKSGKVLVVAKTAVLSLMEAYEQHEAGGFDGR